MSRGVGSFRSLRSAVRYRYSLKVLGCSPGAVSGAVVVTAIMGPRVYYWYQLPFKHKLHSRVPTLRFGRLLKS